MSFISRKVLLTITTVLDVAIHGNGRRVSGKELEARNTLPRRHLEPVLQELVRAGILKGVRGRRGGYELGRECEQITVGRSLGATHSPGACGAAGAGLATAGPCRAASPHGGRTALLKRAVAYQYRRPGPRRGAPRGRGRLGQVTSV